MARPTDACLNDSWEGTYHRTEESAIPEVAKSASPMDQRAIQSLGHLRQQDAALEVLSIDEKSEPEHDKKLPLYKDSRRRLVFFGLLLAWLFKGFDDSVITTIVPTLSRKFDALDLIAWFSAAYFFPQACLAIGFGRLAAVANVRMLVVIDGMLLIVGSILCIAAESAAVFILGRAVTGLGIALGFPLCATILIAITSPDERPLYMAGCVGVDVVSLAFGSLLGGFFETNVDYRWVFAVTIVGAVLSMVFIYPFQQPARPSDHLSVWQHFCRFDFLGFGLFLVCGICVLLALQLATQSGRWNSAPVIALFALAAFTLPLFILQQHMHCRPDDRLLPRGMFSRDMSLLLGFGFFTMFAMYSVYYYLSTYFQSVHGLSSFETGICLLAFFITSGVASLATGISTEFVTYANTIIMTGVTLALVGCAVLTTLDQDTSQVKASLMTMVAGFGFGTAQTLAVVFSQSWVAEHLQPLTVSIALTMQLLGGTLGLVLGGSLLNMRVRDGLQNLRGMLDDSQVAEIAQGSLGPELLKILPSAVRLDVDIIMAQAVQDIFYTATGAVAVALLLAVCMRWHRIKADS
ncbi:major facilitator superfamily domain-containing protein [Apiospora arundinis]|uniref:Major facilitator superfamily domain-containing protein n=1 Tax=Apiospora arundinis TaxID=335852 RepID=A0ABR2IF74_9PEZI